MSGKRFGEKRKCGACWITYWTKTGTCPLCGGKGTDPRKTKRRKPVIADRSKRLEDRAADVRGLRARV